MPKGTRASRRLLKALDMSESEYKEVDPRGVLKEDSAVDEEERKKDNGANIRRRPSAPLVTASTDGKKELFASTRCKSLEETPAVKIPDTGGKSAMEDRVCTL